MSGQVNLFFCQLLPDTCSLPGLMRHAFPSRRPSRKLPLVSLRVLSVGSSQSLVSLRVLSVGSSQSLVSLRALSVGSSQSLVSLRASSVGLFRKQSLGSSLALSVGPSPKLSRASFLGPSRKSSLGLFPKLSGVLFPGLLCKSFFDRNRGGAGVKKGGKDSGKDLGKDFNKGSGKDRENDVPLGLFRLCGIFFFFFLPVALLVWLLACVFSRARASSFLGKWRLFAWAGAGLCVLLLFPRLILLCWEDYGAVLWQAVQRGRHATTEVEQQVEQYKGRLFEVRDAWQQHWWGFLFGQAPFGIVAGLWAGAAWEWRALRRRGGSGAHAAADVGPGAKAAAFSSVSGGRLSGASGVPGSLAPVPPAGPGPARRVHTAFARRSFDRRVVQGKVMLGFGAGGERIGLETADLCAGVLVTGAPGSGKTETLLRICQQVTLQADPWAVIVVDMGGSPDAVQRFRGIAAAAGRDFVSWSLDGPAIYNPLDDRVRCRGTDEIVDFLLACVCWSNKQAEAQASAYLLELVPLLRAAGIPLTLRAVSDYCCLESFAALLEFVETREGGRHLARVREGRAFLEDFSAGNRTRDLDGLRVLRTSLGALGRGNNGYWFGETSPPRLDLFATMCLRGMAVFSLNASLAPSAALAMGRAIIADLSAQCGAMLRLPVADRPPVLLVFDDCAAFTGGSLAHLLVRTRESRMGAVLSLRDLDEARAVDAVSADRFVASTGVKIMHGQRAPAAALQCVEMVGAGLWGEGASSSLLVGQDGTTASLLTGSALWQLPVGQGVLSGLRGDAASVAVMPVQKRPPQKRFTRFSQSSATLLQVLQTRRAFPVRFGINNCSAQGEKPKTLSFSNTAYSFQEKVRKLIKSIFPRRQNFSHEYEEKKVEKKGQAHSRGKWVKDMPNRGDRT